MIRDTQQRTRTHTRTTEKLQSPVSDRKCVGHAWGAPLVPSVVVQLLIESLYRSSTLKRELIENLDRPRDREDWQAPAQLVQQSGALPRAQSTEYRATHCGPNWQLARGKSVQYGQKGRFKGDGQGRPPLHSSPSSFGVDYTRRTGILSHAVTCTK